jgi:8-oxo-dGTP pyrophosphatase MutT (NUDIX family)
MRRAAFVLILNRTKDVLLVRSLTNTRFTQHWSLPGGIVEPDESSETAAIREAFEEVGVVCTIERELSQTKPADTNVHATTFLAHYESGKIVMQAHEIDEAMWVSIDQALRLPLAFNIASLLKQLQQDSKLA